MLRLAICLIFWAASAQATCRQALALGLDVSGSVDAADYRLQLDGLANALITTQVEQAFFIIPDAPVDLAIYTWAGLGQQRIILPWTTISNRNDLQSVSNRLRRVNRATGDPGTALGQAMQFGLQLLNDRPDCWAHTLDISGDGKNNQGPDPRDVAATAGHTIINGLVIGTDGNPRRSKEQLHVAELNTYYRTHVLSGPGAFVQTALGFQDFERSMARKLERELQLPAIGLLDQ